jgi:mevalonate kinase
LRFRSNGKLLISGEYLVLKGASALAIPTSFGQELIVSSNDDEHISWTTKYKDSVIFKAHFDLKGHVIDSDDKEMSANLSKILICILNIIDKEQFNPSSFEANLEFPMEWGLGSSSTLIYNLSRYFEIDPFLLLERTFGGSGYDVACAGSNKPIIYSLKDEKPSWQEVEFNPVFSDQLFFVYLNSKMNSRKALNLFSEKEDQLQKETVERINEITQKLCETRDITVFGELLIEHENIISEFLGINTVKKDLFSDYHRPIKSLGAWGGDFVLVIGESNEMDYFRNRGYETIIPYSEMVLKEDSEN